MLLKNNFLSLHAWETLDLMPVWFLCCRTSQSLQGAEVWTGPTQEYNNVCSVAKLCQTLGIHGLQHARLPCLSLSPGVCSNSCSLSQWCSLAISSSAAPFSFCLQSFPASRSFPTSQLFTSGGQSIGTSASVSILLMNISLGFTGLSSLQSRYNNVAFAKCMSFL